jgi:hypothetical protein
MKIPFALSEALLLLLSAILSLKSRKDLLIGNLISLKYIIYEI